MVNGAPERPRFRLSTEMLTGIGLAVFVLAACFYLLQLWRVDLSVPMVFGGDLAFAGALVKGMIDHGWVWHNASVGAPGVMNMLDYPNADAFLMFVMKVISLFRWDWAFTINVFYVLTYPAIAVTAFWGSRRVGLSLASSFVVGALFAFLPYHLHRNVGHLFLSAYFLVPLAASYALSLWGDDVPLLRDGALDLRSKRAALVLGTCALVGLSGVYYAYFACIFFVVAGLAGWWRTRERLRLVVTAAMLGAVILATAVSVAPSIWYRTEAGPNSQVAARGHIETEVYPLRMTLMMLPTGGHRSPKLGATRTQYAANMVAIFGGSVINEGDTATLGLVGVFGMLVLVFAAIFGSRGSPSAGMSPSDRLLQAAAGLFVIGLLIGTASGFGSMISFVYAQIRCYNRISVYLAYFALIAVAVVFDRVVGKLHNRVPYVAVLLAGVLVVFGLWDQTSPMLLPPYEAARAEYTALQQYVSTVEAQLPQGASVFQLPVVPFPENPPVVGMGDYDHFKPYLASKSLKWSYGAVKGRETSQWQMSVAGTPVGEMCAALKGAGFSAVEVDRFGYPDEAKTALETELAPLSQPPLVSADGRYAVYQLR